MIPGRFSKLSEGVLASAATITPVNEFTRLTGSTQVNTITPPSNGGFATVLYLTPVDGTLVFGTSGNILVGATVAQNRPCTFIWSPVLAKWLIGPIS